MEKRIEIRKPHDAGQASFLPEKTPDPCEKPWSINGIFRKEDSSNHQPEANAGDASKNTVHEEEVCKNSKEMQIPEGIGEQ